MYKAVIFDFDGVIFDSERWWSHFENGMLSSLMPNWTEDDVHKLKGRSVFDTYTFLCEEFGLSLNREEYLEKIDEVARNVYDNCEPIDGIFTFIDRCLERNMQIAIASSSCRAWIDQALEKWNVEVPFEAIISCNDIPVGQGKPHPAIYLKAAEAINVDPATCIVLEDASHGITSAKAAGMYCIGLKNDPESQQDFSEADEVVLDFTSIDLKKDSDDS